MKNGAQPINPVRISGDKPLSDWTALGLTKREYFAAMAMQGLLSAPGVTDQKRLEIIPAASTALADNLLKQLEA